MSDDEFDAFIDQCREEAMEKQNRLQSEFGLGGGGRYEVDKAQGSLRFFTESGTLKAEARFTPIGSYSKISNTFKWAWANDSFEPHLRTKSERLKSLQAVTGLGVFAQELFQADEAMIDDAVFMAVHHLRSFGYYRIPKDSSLYVCVSLDEVKAFNGPAA